MAGTILFSNGSHQCIAFSDLVRGEGIQSNQFLIINKNGNETDAAIIDPGGDLTYTPLTLAILKHTDMRHVRMVIGSHQDPDIIASMPRWLIHTDAKIVISRLWERFLPHLNSAFTLDRLKTDLSERMLTLPDSGGALRLGNSYLFALPAHFLHSVGNFQFYDPISKILFSGDMGASMVGDPHEPVTDFAAHIPTMLGFHRRYMGSKKATRLWAAGVRELDVEMIVPQHGKAFVGKAIITQFLDWISELDCGIDLLTANNYTFAKMVRTLVPPPPFLELPDDSHLL